MEASSSTNGMKGSGPSVMEIAARARARAAAVKGAQGQAQTESKVSAQGQKITEAHSFRATSDKLSRKTSIQGSDQKESKDEVKQPSDSNSKETEGRARGNSFSSSFRAKSDTILQKMKSKFGSIGRSSLSNSKTSSENLSSIFAASLTESDFKSIATSISKAPSLIQVCRPTEEIASVESFTGFMQKSSLDGWVEHFIGSRELSFELAMKAPKLQHMIEEAQKKNDNVVSLRQEIFHLENMLKTWKAEIKKTEYDFIKVKLSDFTSEEEKNIRIHEKVLNRIEATNMKLTSKKIQLDDAMISLNQAKAKAAEKLFEIVYSLYLTSMQETTTKNFRQPLQMPTELKEVLNKIIQEFHSSSAHEAESKVQAWFFITYIIPVLSKNILPELEDCFSNETLEKLLTKVGQIKTATPTLSRNFGIKV